MRKLTKKKQNKTSRREDGRDSRWLDIYNGMILQEK